MSSMLSYLRGGSSASNEASTSALPASSPPSAPVEAVPASSAALTTEYPSSYYNPQASLEEEEEALQRRSSSVLLLPTTAFALGFFAGLYKSAGKASLVFMAENAHRRPDTVQGWYFYNKTKNYKVLLAGLGGGVRTGLAVSAWTGAYLALERGLGELRQRSNVGGLTRENGSWIEGSLAGAGIALGASLLYKLPKPLARRAVLLGLTAGGTSGALRLLQTKVAQAGEREQGEEKKALAAATGVAR